jgi:hypothetical protein
MLRRFASGCPDLKVARQFVNDNTALRIEVQARRGQGFTDCHEEADLPRLEIRLQEECGLVTRTTLALENPQKRIMVFALAA